ncbi:MAG: M16 family metallopeptidase, partial [bacterium]
CEVISGLLSYGRTSRFYQKLVEERKIAVDISTSSSFPGVRYPNLFVIFATPRHPHTTEELEKAIYKELEELATTPVSERELKKIQNQIQADYLRQLSSNSKLAYWLSYYQCLFGDWRFLTQRLKDYEKVTPEDVIRVARQYFQERNRTVGVLIKSGAKKEER